jgi:cell fate regulator YaaT (PSP1 superfamily)
MGLRIFGADNELSARKFSVYFQVTQMDNIQAPKPRPVPAGRSKKYMLVRYSRMSILGWFEHQESQIPWLHHRVVVKTERGLELGEIVGQLCPYKAGQFKLDQDEVKKYFQNSGVELTLQPEGKLIRFATAEDLGEERHLRKSAAEELDCCKKLAKEMNLPMKIVDAEHVFGGERILFYFMADGRVDFRELVKKLAHEYQTRIEMRQIGPRDEAKVLGDMESCGQECCCIAFLKVLKPVNMRMAKMQKATLDPSKISGYCGRLKCCLRYEDEAYTELKKRLPKKNSIVKTAHGQGRVVDGQILTQLVVVELSDGSKVAVNVAELEVISSPEGMEKESEETPSNKTGNGNHNNKVEDSGENQQVS